MIVIVFPIDAAFVVTPSVASHAPITVPVNAFAPVVVEADAAMSEIV